MVKVFYNSNAAMEDWHSIELPDVCPYHIRQIIESCVDPDPTKVPAAALIGAPYIVDTPLQRPSIEDIISVLSNELRLQNAEAKNMPDEPFGEGDGYVLHQDGTQFLFI